MDSYPFISMPYLWAVFSFLAVVGLVPPLKMLAIRLGHVDKPCARKAHEGLVPLIGGIAVFSVFIVLSMLAGYSPDVYWPLYSALSLLLIIGAIDDRYEVRSWVKFGVQFLAAFLIVWFGEARLYQLGNLFGFGDVGLDLIWLPFSVVSVVLLINAINLMDGLDGLAGGTVFVILGWLLYACLGAGEPVYSLSIMVLMGALAGFLFYNLRTPWRHKASIFMGDAGSMCLGLMVAWFAIHLSPEDGRVIEPMSVAWVLALPIWDECAQFYRRVKEGRHPFSADRGHFHHHFLKAGFTPGRAVMLILLLVFLMGGFGVVGAQLGVALPVLTILWMALILAHIFYSRNLENYPKLIAKMK